MAIFVTNWTNPGQQCLKGGHWDRCPIWRLIRGTRVTVELILRKLGEGATEADLLDAYPRLTRKDIQAALAYAADSLAHETILLQPA